MDTYSIIKSLHVISVIAWMAGMLYLPRLFIYHCDAEPGSVQSETFKVMERRLMMAIINPAMVASFLFGGLMLWVGYQAGIFTFTEGWLHLKLLMIIGLGAMHGMFSRWRKGFAADANTRSTRFYRVANEIPTLMMIVIVIMVIVKPF